MGGWADLSRRLQRRRVFPPDQLEQGKLRRCLSIWDLTALGVGSTLGVGVYVIVGTVAVNLAGPAVVLSFLIAAIAAMFAGMCYAEFGARVPRAGSSYIYSLVTMGELVAFIIGWNMILEGLFGTASVARGLSMYVDSMLNKTMSDTFASIAPISVQPFSPYFDFFSCAVVLILGVVLCAGARGSATVNNALALFNMIIILFIIIAGAVNANPANWKIPAIEVPENFGKGGFFAYGIWGVLKGAAVCFYGFVGFDTVSSTGEEVKNPRRVIPVAILSVLGTAFFAYAGVSIVLTMMVPYYMQDMTSAVADAFTQVGWGWARWVVSAGAIFGISASLFGAMFPLPRLLYAMSADGLMLHWLGAVARNGVPIVATLLSAFVIATLSAVLELNELVMMMCVGTLLSYTIVAACVILLRYRSSSTSTTSYCFVRRIFCCGEKAPTKTSSYVVKITLVLFVCVCLSTALVVTHTQKALIPTVVLHAIGLLLIIVMAIQPQNKEELSFKTPLVPLIPCLSIYVNIHLMILISVETWIRVLIWMAIGIPVYIICASCYKNKYENDDDVKIVSQIDMNGKPTVQIFVESPTPPDTIKGHTNIESDEIIQEDSGNTFIIREKPRNTLPFITEEITVQQAYVEDTAEKEAKIIDLLDQVIQAEEDSYGEIISLKETVPLNETPTAQENHQRKSFSEVSDAGSDTSTGMVLSKYDVVAQVHREDLPRVAEEDEKCERSDDDIQDTTELTVKTEENNEHKENYNENIVDPKKIVVDEESETIEDKEREIVEDKDSDTNSRTDESGYSDTLDKSPLHEVTDSTEAPNIPVPPPPPLDENFFTSPNFIKSYTISARPVKARLPEPEELKPRLSVQSNGSTDDEPMTFGSDKQISFMSKLNTIFQNKISEGNENSDEKLTRSNSAGNLTDNMELAVLNRERPKLFLDLKKELMSRDQGNLKPVKLEENTSEPDSENEETLSKEDLKSKLENIFASGGPKMLKARLMKSNPPTPEEAYQTDTSSIDSISKMPKMEKNDTLKRQKDKFGQVLNSLRLSLRDDQV